MMGDPRPLSSPADASVVAIGVDAQAELRQLLARTADRVLDLPGNPAERENDALSLISLLAAVGAKQLVGEIMLRKGAGFVIAHQVATRDISERLVDMLEEVVGRPWEYGR